MSYNILEVLYYTFAIILVPSFTFIPDLGICLVIISVFTISFSFSISKSKFIFFNFFVYIIGMRFRSLLIFEQNVLTIHF